MGTVITPASMHLADLGYGLVIGAAALAVAVAARAAGGSRWQGLAASVAPLAAAIALVTRHRGPAVVLVAVAIASVGAVAARPFAVHSTGLAAVALVVVAMPSSYSLGARMGAALVMILVGVGLEVTRGLAPAVTTVLLGLTVLGAWAAVPDTESIILVAGSLAPIAAMVLIRPRVAISPASWPLSAVVVAAMASGATARPGVLAGALACWGVLAVLPFGLGTLRLRHILQVVALVVATQFVVVLAASRWASRISPPARAWIAAAVLLAFTALAMRVIATAGGHSGEPAEM